MGKPSKRKRCSWCRRLFTARELERHQEGDVPCIRGVPFPACIHSRTHTVPGLGEICSDCGTDALTSGGNPLRLPPHPEMSVLPAPPVMAEPTGTYVQVPAAVLEALEPYKPLLQAAAELYKLWQASPKRK